MAKCVDPIAQKLLNAIFGPTSLKHEARLAFTIKPGPGKGLCHRCKNSHIFRGTAEKEHLIRCSGLQSIQNIPFEVSECNLFRDVGVMSKHEMEQMALIIVRKKGGAIGFMTPKEFRKSEEMDKYGELTPDREDLEFG